MKDFIKKFRYKKNVGFAHCTSRDLYDERSLSAGVAKVFKEQFTKPKIQDCLNDYLCRQNTKGGATVYSLLTKERFFGRPQIEDYNLAFKHFTEEFQKSGLTHLICSPMGCVRDEIAVENFTKNIVAFWRATGASINVIVYKEHSKKKLRNGLSFSEFVERLRSSISLDLQVGNKQVPQTPNPGLTETIGRAAAPLLSEPDNHNSTVVVCQCSVEGQLCEVHKRPNIASGQSLSGCVGDISIQSESLSVASEDDSLVRSLNCPPLIGTVT